MHCQENLKEWSYRGTLISIFKNISFSLDRGIFEDPW